MITIVLVSVSSFFAGFALCILWVRSMMNRATSQIKAARTAYSNWGS